MMIKTRGIGTVEVVPDRGGGVRDWQRWTPYAAVAWSLIYAVLGMYWAVSGRGFLYTHEAVSDTLGPVLGRFGSGMAWIVIIMAGIPAAALGAAMLRGIKVLRPFFIAAGAVFCGILLLLMTGLNLLVMVGYLPAEKSRAYFEAWTQWLMIYQLLCLIGGFLWLAATICYARLSRDACLYCGRRDGPAGWTGPDKAAPWGHIAVYVAMVASIFYAFIRYAWALGFPLGMAEERFRNAQESRRWVSGALFLGNFIRVGEILMLGLIQLWGEVFPRWMIGLARRRVPIALAVIPD